MFWRLFVLLVATVAYSAGANAADAAFHCVVKSAYYGDRGEQPVPDKVMLWENTKVDVLVHGGKAFVTHQLFGITNPMTDEFTILQQGGAENEWTLAWHSALSGDFVKHANSIVIHIRTWGLKGYGDPIRFYLDYYPDIMLGTCDRTAGEVGFKKSE